MSETINLCVRLPVEQHEKLKELSDKEYRTMTSTVLMLIQDYLSKPDAGK